MSAQERKLILATPQPNCAACQRQSIHTKTDWKLHPFRGHGFQERWSHPDLKPKVGKSNER
jgi:hypothetical protein